MYLKSIKLVGFKSFVDATTFPIKSNMNAIVGPNGCGKSNVVDAIRWVIGESSAKQLRGQSMADVIFNGTNSRKPVGKAAVELLFDNSDGRLGGEFAKYTEVAIRREVSRDGQSDYFLNGTGCRRKDIIDIFLGTGLGPRSYAIIEQGMVSRLIENWRERAEGRKTLVFCATVQNSVDLCQEFNDAGISAAHVDGGTAEEERKRIFADFKSGLYTVLCNCGIATKGYDCPEVSCIVLYRATMSLPLYLQMIGRGSRIFPGKENFIILDFGQNHRHGFYDTPRTWTLENPKKKKKTDVFSVKNCKQCDALIPVAARTCSVCGYVYEVSDGEKSKERLIVMLKELSPSQIQRFANNASLEELEIIREEKNYSPMWVWHKLRTVEEFVELEKMKGYKKGWALKKANEFLRLNLDWRECYG